MFINLISKNMLNQEKIVEKKTCKHCNSSFNITDKDLEFYEKVSPTFLGKKYSIPTPTLCPDCRQQRRLSFRNERKLYKRNCDASGKPIISIYSPDKPYKVYNQDFWWSDNWNPLDYEKDFDFNRNFFEQFHELFKEVPLINLYQIGCENSEYSNHSYYNKNCYLITGGLNNNNLLYSSECGDNNDSMDLYIAFRSSNCYESINIKSCNNVFFSINTQNSTNSYFLYNCNGCDNCFMCENLVNKKYFIKNIQFSKEDYEIEINNILKNNSINKLKLEFINRKNNSIKLNISQIGCENCIGDELYNCKNCKNCFTLFDSQNASYIRSDGYCIDTYDCYGTTSCPLSLEGLSFVNGDNKAFGIMCVDGSKLYYNILSYNCNNCFGCVGLKSKEYCILNKQYSKEEYENLVPKIIEHMISTGEWGEFFPASISPFGYNETVAEEYFQLSKNEALEKGFKWSDYEAPFPKVDKIIKASMLPDDISKIPDDIVNWAIECEVSKKPFRIVKAELEFYRKHNLPIPKRHPDQRHLDRLSLRNPRKLFDRKCDKCGKDIKTTYSPDRKEIVYCENCYEKEVY